MLSRHKISGAFTLIELLVAMGVIAVLLALALPVLGAVRQRGQHAVSESRIRTHAQVFHAYASEHRGRWPNVAERSDEPTWYTINGRHHGIANYFDQVNVWHIALVMAYYDGDLFSETFMNAGHRRQGTYEELLDNDFAYVNWYAMSASLLADPAYWNELTRRGPEQWRGTSVGEVRFPSNKAILVEQSTISVLHPRSRHAELLLSAAADGSVARRPIADYTEPYYHGNGHFPGTGETLGYGHYAHHTVDGVLGRDW